MIAGQAVTVVQSRFQPRVAEGLSSGDSSTAPDSLDSVQENRQPISVVRVHQYEEQNEVED
jgi:hypothetical protein